MIATFKNTGKKIYVPNHLITMLEEKSDHTNLYVSFSETHWYLKEGIDELTKQFTKNEQS